MPVKKPVNFSIILYLLDFVGNSKDIRQMSTDEELPK